MCDTSSITVGTIVVVKVGRNETEVVVTEIGENRWKVKKVGSDHEFAVSKIERVLGEPPSVTEIDPAAEPANEPITEPENVPDETAPEAAPITETAEPGQSPVPRAEGLGGTMKQPHGLSLLNAAAQILKRSRSPLNTKEILAKVIESELWTPNGGKTPEQSLYSALFREINTKESPRFRKSEEKKGSFEYNR